MNNLKSVEQIKIENKINTLQEITSACLLVRLNAVLESAMQILDEMKRTHRGFEVMDDDQVADTFRPVVVPEPETAEMGETISY